MSSRLAVWPFVAVGALAGAVLGNMHHREEVKLRLRNPKTVTLNTQELADELIAAGKASLVEAGKEIKANRVPSADLLRSCYRSLPVGSSLAERLGAAFPFPASSEPVVFG